MITIHFLKTWEDVYTKATMGLNKVYKCLRDRHLTINKDKTMFMSFSINKILPILIQ